MTTLEKIVRRDSKDLSVVGNPQSPLLSEVTTEPILEATLQGGKFSVLRELGKGGFARVFLCHNNQLERQQAIKVLECKEDEKQKLTEYLRREARVLFDSSHPNLVKMYDLHENGDGTLHLAMEYVEGLSLREVAEGEGFRVSQAIEIGRQILEGLDHLHSNGIAHCDISPGNILIKSTSNQGRKIEVKIIDLGAAKIKGIKSNVNSINIGTPKYMAPEMWTHGRNATMPSKADLYSVGVILYELLAGEYPYRFEAESPDLATLKRAHEQQEPGHFSTSRRFNCVPSVVQEIVFQMLNKEPASRATARQLADRLKAFQELECSHKILAASAALQWSSKNGIGNRTRRVSAVIQKEAAKKNNKDFGAYADQIEKELTARRLSAAPPQGLDELGTDWMLPLLGLVVSLACVIRIVIF